MNFSRRFPDPARGDDDGSGSRVSLRDVERGTSKFLKPSNGLLDSSSETRDFASLFDETSADANSNCCSQTFRMMKTSICIRH